MFQILDFITLMAVITLRMAFYSVHTAFASPRHISFPSWTPTRTSGHPTDLSLTHRTFQPITAPFFQHDNLETMTCIKLI